MGRRRSTLSQDRRPYCGSGDQPGLAIDQPDQVDWSERPTTPDQASIEDAIDRLIIKPDDRILHVGIGNSSLARRFASRVHLIDGVTIAHEEKTLADALGIPNYTAYLANKYSPAFRSLVSGSYDYIVDNNLASYVCCVYHLHWLLENYRRSLREGGRVLTHRAGMEWTVAGNEAWHLSISELAGLGARFDLEAGQLGDGVYELRRPGVMT
jgi:hypothetical protein